MDQPLRHLVCNLVVSLIHTNCFHVFRGPSSVIDVSTKPLAVATKYAFLPNTRDVYDVKSVVSTANDRWF